jgi:RHS repeat-associated protein
VFDRNYVFLDGGFKQISTVARETGTDVAHEYLASPKITITQPGYVYIYISNENATNVEVYFDDFRVAQAQNANVIQAENYYMFGMAFQEYQKDGSVANPYKYNGKEEQDEMGLGWLDYGARMYMPELGRWGVIDGKADNYFSISPYNFVMNNPIIAVDPDGNEIVIIGDDKYRTSVRQALADLSQTPEGARLVNSLMKSEHVTVIHFGGKGVNNRYAHGETSDGKSGSWIHFDPNSETQGLGVPGIAYVSLSHELRHSEQDSESDPNWKKSENGDYPEAKLPNSDKSIPFREVDAVNNTENKVRAAIPGAGRRDTYKIDGVILNIRNIVISGKTYQVKETDYKSFSGKTAPETFKKIMKALNNGVTLRMLMNYNMKSSNWKKGVYNHKYNRDDKATVIDQD